ncbi:hypothetical protein GCM10017653_11020 [Ancylobacter defluvii]|uniref:Uncharacterized protein n=1 Tax=Ancylobacter defluvii TaxID=1282440 RepID=A0A9W6JX53_9HYPH|nr:hypothetical protein GCM10017653_11020 [Ancylobacter defluvii]
MALKLTEGQALDGVSAADMPEGLGDGQILLADRACDSDRLRQSLSDRGAFANVRPIKGRKRTLASATSVPSGFFEKNMKSSRTILNSSPSS